MLSFEQAMSLTNQINEIPGMKDVIVSFITAPSRKDISILESYIGHKLPPKIAEYYNKTYGIDIRWKYRDTDSSLVISANGMPQSPKSLAYGLHYAFKSLKKQKGTRHENYLWNKSDEKKYIDEMEEYCIIDKIDTNKTTFTLIKFADENTEPVLFLFKYPHYICPLTIGYEDYFEAAFQCRMIEGWQDYFIDKNRCDEKTLLYLQNERTYPSLAKLKSIFPGLNTSLFPDNLKEEPLLYEQTAIDKKYYKRFSDKFKHLENMIAHSEGSFKLKEHQDPLTIHTIRKIEATLGRKLPDSMLALYSQFNGFELQWSYNPAGKYKDGSRYRPGSDFKLLGLDQVFGGNNPSANRVWHDQMWEGILTMEDVFDEDTFNFAKQCRPVIIESYTVTAIRFTDGVKEPELYLLVRGKFYKLPLTFTELVEELLSNMGMTDWQKFLLDEMDFSDHEIAFSCGPAVRFIKDVFPDVDTAKYRNSKTNVDEDVLFD
jgi:hypothetical protein